MQLETSNFATEYAEWLTSRLSATVYSGISEISTPFLDVHNDGLRVYVEPVDRGFLLHDNGLTLETLSLQGVEIGSSQRRKELIESTLSTFGLTISNGKIQTIANDTNLPQRVHFLLCAMKRIADLWLTARTTSSTDFFERVCTYLDKKNVLFSTNVVIPGKTVEHPIDILIPLPKRKERLIKLIGTPNVNTAKVVSFSWIEIEQVRPNSERVVLVNDVSSGDDSNTKRLSDQTEAILSGYSTAYYRWSQRNDPTFEALWRTA
jgi:hypothetical protein